MTLKTYLGKAAHEWGKSFARDLEAMPEDVLKRSPGGVSRRPVDYAYEVAVINERIAHRLRGEDPGPWPGPETGFMLAPAEFEAKATLIDFLKSSFENVVAAWNAADEDNLETKIVLPQGETSMLDLMTVVLCHAAYHDGQLNYAQAISGDNEVHWED